MTAQANLDLGRDHEMQWFVPYAGGDERIGVLVWHPCRQDDTRCLEMGVCGGAVFFDLAANGDKNRPKWRVHSLDPLTLTPSLLCHCGDHGYIREGRWVPA